jgi:hypothetical protein
MFSIKFFKRIHDVMVIYETFKLASLLGRCFRTTQVSNPIARYVVWYPSCSSCTLHNVGGSYFSDVGRAGFGELFRIRDGYWIEQ